jgi:repressor of nif and glnA expression
MPFFHLHLHNRLGFIRDEEGKELADLGAAHALALESIRDILSEEAKKGIVDLRGRVEIADPAGQVLQVVTFPEAVELQLGERP